MQNSFSTIYTRAPRTLHGREMMHHARHSHNARWTTQSEKVARSANLFVLPVSTTVGKCSRVLSRARHSVALHALLLCSFICSFWCGRIPRPVGRVLIGWDWAKGLSWNKQLTAGLHACHNALATRLGHVLDLATASAQQGTLAEGAQGGREEFLCSW